MVLTTDTRDARRLPVKVTVMPTADFDASVGVFFEVSYRPEAEVAESTARRRVRAYRVADASRLEAGKKASFSAVLKLPEAATEAWHVRARFGGDGTDMRSAWVRVA